MKNSLMLAGVGGPESPNIYPTSIAKRLDRRTRRDSRSWCSAATYSPSWACGRRISTWPESQTVFIT
jgi:hypothetical protein